MVQKFYSKNNIGHSHCTSVVPIYSVVSCAYITGSGNTINIIILMLLMMEEIYLEKPVQKHGRLFLCDENLRTLLYRTGKNNKVEQSSFTSLSTYLLFQMLLVLGRVCFLLILFHPLDINSIHYSFYKCLSVLLFFIQCLVDAAVPLPSITFI